MTQHEFDKLANHVKSGGTIYIHLATRIIKVDPKCWRRWMEYGRPVLKLGDDGYMRIATRKGYDCLPDGGYGVSFDWH